MLLVTTMIGITAMGTTTLEEKMANNHRQRQIALQAASAALRDAEAWLNNPANLMIAATLETTFDGSTPELFSLRRPTPVTAITPVNFQVNNSSDWATIGNGQPISTSLSNIGTKQPKYIIEYMGRIGRPPLNYTSPDLRQYGFRITAIGWGADDTTIYLTQSSFRRSLN
jgi:type IV pilus assembly protein PilX